MATIPERVALGEAFMDEHDPGWWREDADQAINLAELDLESPESCVLGQRCPASAKPSGYRWPTTRFDAMAATLGSFTSRTQVNKWAAPLGFQASVIYDGDDELDGGEYAALTAEWKRVIGARREAAAAARNEGV
jgi:hypothetical protein